MVDSGCFKTKLKKEKRRSDGDQTGKQTKIRRKKKYGRHTSSIFDSKGVGCAKYEGISVNPCNLWEIDYLNCSQNVVLFWFALVSFAEAG